MRAASHAARHSPYFPVAEIFDALQRSGVEATLERVEEVVKLCDADGNGMVSAQEYVDAVHRKLVPQSWWSRVAPRRRVLERRHDDAT